jgi:flagellar biosynthesis/type III secretory pathway M-ring protein FliF/YscJ
MSQSQINALITFAWILIIVVIIAVIWFIIWTAIFIPIKKKDDLLKEREEARTDLLEIQAAKSIEWDKYKELQEETDKMRKAYFQAKEAKEKLQEEKAKLEVDKENLINFNRELKKRQTEQAKKSEK